MVYTGFMEDDLDWQFERIDNSRPPLRWVANFLGELGTYCIVRAFDAQDMGKDKTVEIYAKLGTAFMKPYNKWGTYYKVKKDIEE